MLHGVRHDLQKKLTREGQRVRVYIPLGSGVVPLLHAADGGTAPNLRFFLRAFPG